MEAANEELYWQLKRVVLDGQNLDALSRFVAEDFVDHGALPGQPPGIEGIRGTLGMLFQAFPDLEVTIDHLVADGSLVIAHGTARGTHEGAFLGVPPTGETVTWEFFDMGRVQNGRFTERWGMDDTLGIMQQLGVAPAPGEGE
jgi:predicted ester cyclase